MKNKKYFACAAVATALFINLPQVSAADVVTFGEEFDDENNSEIIPFQDENSDDEEDDYGPVLIFNDPEKLKNKQPVENPEIENPEVEDPEIEDPAENPPPEDDFDSDNKVVITPSTYERERILPPSRVNENLRDKEQKKRMKTQKPRFIKFAMDENFIYYLDKQSVSWQRIPYSASEYMLDVWIYMIERNPDTSDLSDDLSDYVNDTTNGEIELAREKGILFSPEDIEVLSHKKYFLEHYYLRPKTKQIQFLSTLEVVGRPQNTVSEREYNYKNWENLIPGSMESIIYYTTIKNFGKSGATDKGHMTFTDMLEEYARISIR